MKITLNNRTEIIPDGVKYISDLLKYKNFSFPRIVVKVNGVLIKKPDFTSVSINENDTVEIIHLVSGG